MEGVPAVLASFGAYGSSNQEDGCVYDARGISAAEGRGADVPRIVVVGAQSTVAQRGDRKRSLLMGCVSALLVVCGLSAAAAVNRGNTQRSLASALPSENEKAALRGTPLTNMDREASPLQEPVSFADVSVQKTLYNQAEQAYERAREDLTTKQEAAQGASETEKTRAEQDMKDAQAKVDAARKAVEAARQQYARELQRALQAAQAKLEKDKQLESQAALAKSKADEELGAVEAEYNAKKQEWVMKEHELEKQAEVEIENKRHEWEVRAKDLISQAEAEVRQKQQEWALRERDLQSQAAAALQDVKLRVNEKEAAAEQAEDADDKAEGVVEDDEDEVEAKKEALADLS